MRRVDDVQERLKPIAVADGPVRPQHRFAFAGRDDGDVTAALAGVAR